jgi:hypothetical protein
LSAAVAADKDDAGALEALGHELRAAALYLASNRHYERALRTRPVREQLARRAAILIGMGRNHLELQSPKEAAPLFERCLRESTGQPWEPEAMLGLGRALLAQKKDGAARQILETLTDRHRGSRAAEEATRLLSGR